MSEEAKQMELNPMIEKMIDDLDLRSLPEEELESFRGNMEMQISRRLGLIIVENLNDEGLAEYEKIIESDPVPDPDKVKALIEKYIPDFDAKVKEGLDEFYQSVVSGTDNE